MHRLPRAIGVKRAMGILLTGRHVSAREGYELGFVTALAQRQGALAEAKAWAAQMLECSPMSLRATSRRRCAATFADVEQAYRAEYEAVTRLRASKDYVEGPRAFARSASRSGAVTSGRKFA
jgi:crotonobetainyl-CoA hydratase